MISRVLLLSDWLCGFMRHANGDTGREQCELLADAERVVKKEEQIMMDAEFTQDYSLTVFPFSRDVSMVWFQSTALSLLTR